MFITISTLTVERVVSRLTAQIIENFKAYAMSIIFRSKNLRRRVKNAFLGPKKGSKAPKSFFSRFEFVILITPLSTHKTIFLTGDPVKLICFAVRDLIIIYNF